MWAYDVNASVGYLCWEIDIPQKLSGARNLSARQHYKFKAYPNKGMKMTWLVCVQLAAPIRHNHETSNTHYTWTSIKKYRDAI